MANQIKILVKGEPMEIHPGESVPNVFRAKQYAAKLLIQPGLIKWHAFVNELGPCADRYHLEDKDIVFLSESDILSPEPFLPPAA